MMRIDEDEVIDSRGRESHVRGTDGEGKGEEESPTESVLAAPKIFRALP